MLALVFSIIIINFVLFFGAAFHTWLLIVLLVFNLCWIIPGLCADFFWSRTGNAGPNPTSAAQTAAPHPPSAVPRAGPILPPIRSRTGNAGPHPTSAAQTAAPHPPSAVPRAGPILPPPPRRFPAGLRSSQIASLPAFPFKRRVVSGGDSDGSNGGDGDGWMLCAVCLSVVTVGEIVRSLPACQHSFHAECVDLWLRSHATCPICRTAVLGLSPVVGKESTAPPSV